MGDRVTLQVELGTLGADPSKLSIKPEDAATKPEDSGWFIDPSTLSQGGILRFVVSPLKGGSLTLPALMISGSEDRVLAKTVPFAMTVTAPATSDTGKPDLLDVLSVQLPLRY
ncbi:hypothetical protein EB061_12910, partial [bacterium]|nr:hypothetical protein [bacterium]